MTQLSSGPELSTYWDPVLNKFKWIISKLQINGIFKKSSFKENILNMNIQNDLENVGNFKRSWFSIKFMSLFYKPWPDFLKQLNNFIIIIVCGIDDST